MSSESDQRLWRLIFAVARQDASSENLSDDSSRGESSVFAGEPHSCHGKPSTANKELVV